MRIEGKYTILRDGCRYGHFNEFLLLLFDYNFEHRLHTRFYIPCFCDTDLKIVISLKFDETFGREKLPGVRV